MERRNGRTRSVWESLVKYVRKGMGKLRSDSNEGRKGI